MGLRHTSSTLGEILVESGILRPEDLRRGLEEQTRSRVRLGEALVSLGLVTRDDLCWALSRQYALSYVHPRDIALDPSCASLFPEALARRHHAAPLFEAGGDLHVVLEDPLAIEALADADELHAVRLNVSIGPSDEVRELVERLYGPQTAETAGSDERSPGTGEAAVVAHGVPEAVIVSTLQDSSGQALLALILDVASEEGARAVHFEVDGGRGRVRFRRDGALADRFSLRRDWHARIVERLERLSGSAGRAVRDLSEGHVQIDLGGVPARLPVAFLATASGASAIVGLLAREMAAPLLPEIGLSSEATQRLQLLAARGHGLWIVTGHQWESSGVIAHALLRHLNRPELRVVSFRDDTGSLARREEFAHVQIARHSTTPLDLEMAARNDFDVVLVGRLYERTDIDRALETAARGKTVVGTMDFRTPRTVLRFLLSYGFNRGLVAAELSGILAQREIRVLCPHCRVVDERAPRLEFPWRNESPRALTALRGAGCPKCGHTGVRGREFLLEFWPSDEALGRALLSEDPMARLSELPGPSLLEMGMERVRRGETPLEDVAALFEN